MDSAALVEIVGAVGFPIVACIFMGWFISSVMMDFKTTIEENNNVLKNLQEFINTVIKERIDVDD